MDGAHQSIVFYQNLVFHRVVEEDPVVEVAPSDGPEEYVDTDYDFEESDEETDTDYIRSLKEEITNLKRQLFAAEARAVRAEQREDVITQEVNDVAELMISQLDD
ncbi:unnamed protein product [Lactuca saligna]|uniref:Uncharacterized protein n=1 Tax=Lactuca saligna TaxID=75948 RepID=A0AA35YPZ1_LACSI|nr:unnamed protein product [Lactuca saligna]